MKIHSISRAFSKETFKITSDSQDVTYYKTLGINFNINSATSVYYFIYITIGF